MKPSEYRFYLNLITGFCLRCAHVNSTRNIRGDEILICKECVLKSKENETPINFEEKEKKDVEA